MAANSLGVLMLQRLSHPAYKTASSNIKITLRIAAHQFFIDFLKRRMHRFQRKVNPPIKNQTSFGIGSS
jgi:hypothetical protein